MGKFAHTAVFVVAMSVPALASVVMGHSVVSVLGAPGGCVPTALSVAPTPATQGKHKGGYRTGPVVGESLVQAGTVAVPDGSSPSAGHQESRASGTVSGNFTKGTPNT
jgi:hypothetical protein